MELLGAAGTTQPTRDAREGERDDLVLSQQARSPQLDRRLTPGLDHEATGVLSLLEQPPEPREQQRLGEHHALEFLEIN